MRHVLAVTCAALGSLGFAYAQPSMSDSGYIKQVSKAAPPQVVDHATIIRMQGNTMKTLRKGTNEFTCMIIPGNVPMCADPGAMAWAHAWSTHSPPTDKTGFMYMLNGDTGTSNTDPYATKKTADNHWVQTGPHVMIVGAAAKTMTGYPTSADPDPTKPYVMWPGTPYAHLMIPVK